MAGASSATSPSALSTSPSVMLISAISRQGATGGSFPFSMCLKATTCASTKRRNALAKPVNVLPGEIQWRSAGSADNGQAERRFGIRAQLVYFMLGMSPNKVAERTEIRRSGRPFSPCQERTKVMIAKKPRRL